MNPDISWQSDPGGAGERGGKPASRPLELRYGIIPISRPFPGRLADGGKRAYGLNPRRAEFPAWIARSRANKEVSLGGIEPNASPVLAATDSVA
jgi:hypothetical protein